MTNYDCIVNANNVYGLTVALFLARKMRKVLVIQDYKRNVSSHEVINITDPENNKYHFEYNSLGVTSGVDSGGLLYEYLDDLGLLGEFNFSKIDNDNIVELDNEIKRRFHTFDQLRVHLIRNYPKSRDRIHRFFKDLDRLYENYVMQNINMLKNRDHTLTSLMIEWGDHNLLELLNKYFESKELKREFLLNSQVNGLKLEDINSYNFFSNYFVGLKKGFYYLNNSSKDLREKLLKKLKIINPNIVIKTRIKDIIKDEDGTIKAFVDKNNKEYHSKFFFIESNPITFYEKYFDDLEADLETIKSYYPHFDSKQKINTIFLALNKHPKNLGLNDLIYYFKNTEDENEQIVKLFNYSVYTNVPKKEKQGLICIDYTYDDIAGASKEKILQRIYEVFPKVKSAVVGMKEGKPKPYLTMPNNLNVTKDLTINELIEIEVFDHIQVFENLYTGYRYFRPESGNLGMINEAMVFADKIEDRLYYGEDDDVFHYLNNEEIMTMIKCNYDYKEFENKEIHVNFHIGKNTYFVRTKGKYIVVHLGKHSNADLSIYTTNDRLSNLLLKKITFNEVLEEGSLKYRGNKELLFKAANAFKLDDYQEYNPLEYKKSKYKNMGAKFLFGYLSIFFIVGLLSNYVNAIYFYPPALALTGVLVYFKIRTYEEVHWFDIFAPAIFLIGTGMAIFWSGFNQMRFDDPILGIMSLALLGSVFANHPILFHYLKFDTNIDYRNSVLFKTISNGLTFVWGVLFLSILVGTYITGERYVSVLYNFYFVGIFLMYFYPAIYVSTSIKK